MLTIYNTKLLSIGQVTDNVLVIQLLKASSCHLLLIGTVLSRMIL